MNIAYLLRAPITLTVIIICVAVYLMQSNPLISGKYAYHYYMIRQGQFYRFLTGGFLHVTPMHLIMNMYSLYNLGTYMEFYLGPIRYTILLLGAIIFGNLFCYLLKVRSAVGLSGGLYGLMLMYICMMLRFTNISLVEILRMNLVNILINFMPGIAWQAHVGGGCFGVLMAVVYMFI